VRPVVLLLMLAFVAPAAAGIVCGIRFASSCTPLRI
jgi:hypothetical protein